MLFTEISSEFVWTCGDWGSFVVGGFDFCLLFGEGGMISGSSFLASTESVSLFLFESSSFIWTSGSSSFSTEGSIVKGSGASVESFEQIEAETVFTSKTVSGMQTSDVFCPFKIWSSTALGACPKQSCVSNTTFFIPPATVDVTVPSISSSCESSKTMQSDEKDSSSKLLLLSLLVVL